MNRILRNIAIVLATAILAATTSNVQANEFWANKLGGGPEEVREYAASPDYSQSMSLTSKKGEHLTHVVFSMSEKPSEKGTDVYLSARLTDNSVVKNVTVSACWKAPNGQERRLKLLDDGNLSIGDEKRGDAIFSNIAPLVGTGVHKIEVIFKGTANENVVKRTSYLNIPIGKNRVSLSSNKTIATRGEVLGKALEDERYGMSINVSLAQGIIPDIVKTRATVWAKNSSGKDVVVGWTGGIVKTTTINDKTSKIPFTFHTGWLTQPPHGGSFLPPLSLRDIELTDIDSGDQMLYSSSPIEIQGIPIPEPDVNGTDDKYAKPTMAMEQGIHPSVLSRRKQ